MLSSWQFERNSDLTRSCQSYHLVVSMSAAHSWGSGVQISRVDVIFVASSSHSPKTCYFYWIQNWECEGCNWLVTTSPGCVPWNRRSMAEWTENGWLTTYLHDAVLFVVKIALNLNCLFHPKHFHYLNCTAHPEWSDCGRFLSSLSELESCRMTSFVSPFLILFDLRDLF